MVSPDLSVANSAALYEVLRPRLATPPYGPTSRDTAPVGYWEITRDAPAGDDRVEIALFAVHVLKDACSALHQQQPWPEGRFKAVRRTR